MSLDEAFSRFISEKEASLFRPSASQIATASKEYGFLEVWCFPSLDSAIAAAIVLRVLSSSGVQATVYFSPEPPRLIEEPSLLLGYPAAVATELTVKKPSALIGYGERPQGLLPLAVTASNDSSIAALTVGVLSEISIVGGFSVYAVAAGFWRGMDRGKRGEFPGVENSIVEMLKLENKVEEHFSLRLMRWNSLATEEAMAVTVQPYLPGLTGSIEAARRMLEEDPRLAQLLGKNMHDAPEQGLAVLGEKLYELLKNESRIPRRPSEIIGLAYYSPSSPLPDLRETPYVLAAAASAAGLHALLGLAYAEEASAAAAHYLYRRSLGETVAWIEEARRGKPQQRRLGRLQIAVYNEEPPQPQLAEKALSQLGVVQPHQAGVYGDKLLAEKVVETAGYEALRELLRQGCLEYLEGSPYVRAKSWSC